jgi:hypothetical protein
MAKKGKIITTIPKQETEEIRPIRWRGYKQFFLIVCEDQATEPAYFAQFKEIFDKITKETIFVKPVGTGKSPKGVVEQAIIEREKLKAEAYKDIDYVWAVFDKDDADKNATTIHNFETAFEIAKNENIQIAYSNEVFELWLLLHLTNVSAKNVIPRKEIYNLLETAIKNSGTLYENFVYEHGNVNIITIISQIGNEEQAIKKAEKLYELQKHKTAIEANPSTQVHLLVKELRAWIGFYST